MNNRNLLVIDWDAFFPNPWEADDPTIGKSGEHSTLGLYDWGHREAPFFIDTIWLSRGVSFRHYGLPLPRVNDEWKEFPKHFNVSKSAHVYHADSNMYAADERLGEYGSVWLVDAHHDCGYGPKTVREWWAKHVDAESGNVNFTCEDWMLVHQLFHMSDLHYRFPKWHRRYREGGVTDVPKGVVLDSAMFDPDEKAMRDVVFDEVFVCRSGAWVPPWEDKKFAQFLTRWNRPLRKLDHAPKVRNWDDKMVEEMVLLRRETMDALDRAKEVVDDATVQ